METLDYNLQTNHGRTVKVPAEVDNLVNKVLFATMMRDFSRAGDSSYIKNEALIKILTEYFTGSIRYPLAKDMATLNIAEQIANKEEGYSSLLAGIAEVSEDVTSLYERVKS